MENKIKDYFFNSVEFEAIQTTNKIVNELKKNDNFGLIGYKLHNAINRNNENEKLDNCIGNYFSYTLNGYRCYIELGYFWMFEGVSILVEKINADNTYNKKHYLYMFENVEKNINELIEALADPQKIYNKQEFITLNSKDNREYVNRKHKIEKHIYY